jgi:hypothetical protein
MFLFSKIVYVIPLALKSNMLINPKLTQRVNRLILFEEYYLLIFTKRALIRIFTILNRIFV